MTKQLHDHHRLDELKNFAANILLKLVTVLGSVHLLVSHVLGVALKGEIVTTEQVQLGVGVRVQL